jgi:dihydroorotate dehydrogenase (NAD+) catalytic subunit
MQPKLSVNIGKIKLKNPVTVASGTFGYAEEFGDFINLKELGAIVTKTITLKPRQGNPPPRTCETPAGMLNSIGLENPGLEAFIREKLPLLKKIGVPIIVSISSEDDAQEFTVLARRLDKIKEVAAIELNISCPNIKLASKPVSQLASLSTGTPAHRHTGKLISQDPNSTYALVKAVRKVTQKTIITKLSPNVTDITEIAMAAQNAGSDAVSLINTLTAISIDIETRKPKIAMVTAGLSGPAIRPVAVRMVWEAYQKIKIPIIGMGGIIDISSALEFIIAGATAISVGTANFINPKVSVEIIEGLKEYLIKNKIKDIRTLIGSLKI